jgi:hypothetical protein
MLGHPNLIIFAKASNGAIREFINAVNATLTASPSFEKLIFGDGIICDNGTTKKYANFGDIGDVGTDNFAVVASFKTSATGAQYIIDKLGADLIGWHIFMNAGQINTRYGNTTATNVFANRTNSTFNDFAAHTLVVNVNRSAKSVSYYVDGVSQAATTVTNVGNGGTSSIDNTTNLGIGTRLSVAGQTQTWTGTLGMVALFRGINFGASEVKRLHLGLHPLTRS